MLKSKQILLFTPLLLISFLLVATATVNAENTRITENTIKRRLSLFQLPDNVEIAREGFYKNVEFTIREVGSKKADVEGKIFLPLTSNTPDNRWIRLNVRNIGRNVDNIENMRVIEKNEEKNYYPNPRGKISVKVDFENQFFENTKNFENLENLSIPKWVTSHSEVVIIEFSGTITAERNWSSGEYYRLMFLYSNFSIEKGGVSVKVETPKDTHIVEASSKPEDISVEDLLRTAIFGFGDEKWVGFLTIEYLYNPPFYKKLSWWIPFVFGGIIGGVIFNLVFSHLKSYIKSHLDSE